MQDVFGCKEEELEICVDSEEFIRIASVIHTFGFVLSVVDSEDIWEVVCSEEEKIEVCVDSEKVYVVGSEEK